MRVIVDRRSPRLPGRVWAVLVGSVLAVLALELTAAVYTFRIWEEDIASVGRVMHVTLGEHLRGWVQASSFLVLLTLLGFVIAWRGRKLLFAAPALSFTVAPILIDLYHGASDLLRPGLIGSFGLLAREVGRLGHIDDSGEWVYWAEAAIKLALVLIPGIVVARRVEAFRSSFHFLAIGLLVFPAWLMGYYGVVFLSAEGQLNSWAGAEYVAIFCFGAAMGLDRPVWPWLIAVLPLLPYVWVAPLFSSVGAEYLPLIGIALLGAITVPLSRVFQRAWTEPDSGRSLSYAAH